MKLHETEFWKSYSRFTAVKNACTMRSTVDAWVYYKLQTQYDFRSVLEIGFFEGQTAGLLAEVSHPSTQILCIDPAPRMDPFKEVFASVQHKIVVLNQPSQQIDFGSKDFIIIDGDKKLPAVRSDLQKAAKACANHGVLAVNEWIKPDVITAVKEVLGPTSWKPFLQTHQTLMFHREDQDRSHFLDEEISSCGASNFMRFENINIDGHTVLEVSSLPVFTDRIDFFDRMLKELDL